MKNIPARSLALILVAASLGGCSSFLGINSANQRQKTPLIQDEAPTMQMADKASTLTELGRKQLDDGLIGAAVDSFQKALGNGEPIAPALNGLGVAYAQLGRDDLALRLFAQAMAANPGDRRYSDNFARLSQSSEVALRHNRDLALEAANAVSPPSLTSLDPQPITVAAGSLQRISRAEVRIETVAPQFAAQRQKFAEMDRQFKPLIRLSIAAKTKAVSPTSMTPLAQSSSTGAPALMQRISRSEVKIITVDPQPAAQTRRYAELNRRFKPLIRISIADNNVKP